MSNYLEVTLSAGNRKNYSLRFKKGETFFPSNSWGGSNEESSGEFIKIYFHGIDEEKETDLDGTKRILRKTRGELRRFYEHYNMKAGDSVFVIKKAPRIFEISPHIPPLEPSPVKSSTDGFEESGARKRIELDRIIRDTKVTLEVKEMYEYACQVCGLSINTRRGGYSEGAHIKPLGSPHDGPDHISNILSLCPNHHLMLDRGVFTINDDLTLSGMPGSLTVNEGHNIELSHIQYHREMYVNA